MAGISGGRFGRLRRSRFLDRGVSERRGGLVDDERGAILIIVGVLMVALLGMTAIVFDLGVKRAERRELVTATDAGALAAAGAFALGDEGGCAVGATFVSATDPGAVMDEGWCSHSGSGSYGVVTVQANQPLDYTFAPVLGVDEGQADSLSMAAYGVPEFIQGGLRPFALCLDVLNSIATLPLTASTGVQRVLYGKDDQPEACNGNEDVPGNWALIDFNGGDNSTGETQEWLVDGYDGPVYQGVVGGDCADDADGPVCYDGDPGAWSNSLRTQLDYLITAGPSGTPLQFTLPVFDSGGSNGSNAFFHLVAFISVKLYGYQATGNSDLRWLDVEFLPGLATGVLGDGTGYDTGLRVVAMCGVEAGSNC